MSKPRMEDDARVFQDPDGSWWGTHSDLPHGIERLHDVTTRREAVAKLRAKIRGYKGLFRALVKSTPRAFSRAGG